MAESLRVGGKSYRDITNLTGVPKSTLSGWFGSQDWSQKIKEKLITEAQKESVLQLVSLNRVRSAQLEAAYGRARFEAEREFESLKYNPIFIAGLMLYFGEGDKVTKNAVRLSNTDPELIKLYVFFLIKVCNVPENKIKGNILLYPDLSEEECLKYWSFVSGVPAENFIKSTQIMGRHKTNRLKYGVCIIVVSSAYLKVKFLRWLEYLPLALMNREYYENI